MPTLQNDKRENQRRRLARDVDEFLANGGQVHQVQPEECKWYQELEKRGKRIHIPLVINPERNAERTATYLDAQKAKAPATERRESQADHPWDEDQIGNGQALGVSNG